LISVKNNNFKLSVIVFLLAILTPLTSIKLTAYSQVISSAIYQNTAINESQNESPNESKKISKNDSQKKLAWKNKKKRIVWLKKKRLAWLKKTAAIERARKKAFILASTKKNIKNKLSANQKPEQPVSKTNISKNLKPEANLAAVSTNKDNSTDIIKDNSAIKTPSQANKEIKNTDTTSLNDKHEQQVFHLNDYPNKKTIKETPIGASLNKPQKSEPNYLSMFLSLGVVIALIYPFLLILRRLQGINSSVIPLRNKESKNVSAMLNKFNILSTASLGQGKFIHLIEINGKQLVIGSTANNINLLTELSQEQLDMFNECKTGDNPELDDFIEYSNPESYINNFSQRYKDYLKEKKSKGGM